MATRFPFGFNGLAARPTHHTLESRPSKEDLEYLRFNGLAARPTHHTRLFPFDSKEEGLNVSMA